ncbi:MAG: NAD(P)H-dependent oxidoreductase [Candidatus Micrarchaeota archaeon]|nr:NAD(P)H-dependent oxidoreductase [Candidatus Micrarchaeota archaeon]
MEFSEVVRRRYATKKFDGRKIPQERLDELLEIIRLAPSSLNLQPWRIKVIADQKTKDELQKASFNQEQVGTCSHLLVFCADTDLEGLALRLEAHLSKSGLPAEKLKGYMDMVRGFMAGLKKGNRLPWAQRQLYIALGNAVNGAKSLGFDSCPMEGFEPEAYRRILKLPENLVPTAIVAVGYAADKPREKFRLPKEEVFF